MSYRASSATYAEVRPPPCGWRRALRGSAIARGDRIAVHLANRPEAVELAFAASRIGAVFMPLNPGLRARQLAHVLKDSGARMLITSGAVAPQLIGTRRFPPSTSWWSRMRSRAISRRRGSRPAAAGSASAQYGCRGYRERVRFQPRGSCRTLLYLGQHRPAERRDAFACESHGRRGHRVSVSRHDPADRILVALPWSFDYGFNQIATAFTVGACAVLTNYASAAALINEIHDERITALAGVPTMWMQLAAARWRATPPAALRYITNSGGALHAATIRALQALLPGTRIFCMYGLTEAFRSTYLDPAELPRCIGSIGKAVPGQQVAVVDEAGRECAAEVVGELVHRGSFVSQGYWNDGALTQRRFRPCWPGDMAVWSGDLARRDADGFLWFVGRQR